MRNALLRRRRWLSVCAALAATVGTVAVIGGIGAVAGAPGTGDSVTATPSATTEPGAPTSVPTSATTTERPAGDSALAAVEALTVKGRAPKTGYDRDQYGDGWADVGGCSTRQLILRRDLDDVTVSDAHCGLVAGTLNDPYSGSTERLTAENLNTVQIDHVVALSDSWQKGAQQWSRAKRVQFANDPLNLMTTTPAVNESKGDGDTATWLPPNKDFRCAYVARQVSVKATYGLWVTAAEKQAMTRVLSTCPDQKLITADEAGQLRDPHADVAASTSDAPQAEATGTASATDPRYPSCAAASRAGFGPYRRGVDPEYEWYRDGDGDGVVCER